MRDIAMWLEKIKRQSIQSIIAHASVLKYRGFYTAAKQLINAKLAQYPNHEALQALYQHIEILQQTKFKQRH